MAVTLPAAFEAVCGHQRARYLPGWVREIEVNADRVTGVILADATRVPSGCVVVAAGPAAPRYCAR